MYRTENGYKCLQCSREFGRDAVCANLAMIALMGTQDGKIKYPGIENEKVRVGHRY